ncbi:hypothetical protein F5Y19DRAFT_426333 [Xylariaceae sp. FL1651]|nr:hypothetical protein F5Y19DRAFT_426333 [Xylariaceae sp. FL1651]
MVLSLVCWSLVRAAARPASLCLSSVLGAFCARNLSQTACQKSGVPSLLSHNYVARRASFSTVGLSYHFSILTHTTYRWVYLDFNAASG